MKHIKENCNTCGVELTDNNWSLSWQAVDRHQCKTCSKNYNDSSNENRMYVNGKYVPQTHPLYKAGRYKTFEGAAFSALQGYEKSNEGYVYVITNPCWKGWVKVGMAIDSKDRCKGYQTSSPLRDYKLKFKKYFNDRRSAEAKAHTLCSKKASDRKGEWFELDIKTAKDIINNMEVILND